MLLIIGLDGAPFELVEAWLKAGDLPHLGQIAASGGRRILQSTMPPISPAAWMSLATGTPPATHSVFGFHRLAAGAYDLEMTDATSALVPTVWRVLTGAGKRVGLANVPWSYPPDRALEGVVVARGIGSPPDAARTVHPPAEWERIVRAIGEPPANVPNDDPGLLPVIARNIRWQGDLALYLLRQSLDVLAVVFAETDRVQHQLWGRRDVDWAGEKVHDPLLRTYQLVDEQVGRLVEAVGSTAHVVVLSDHGAGPCEGVLNLNRAFAEAGLLAFRPAASAAGGPLRRALIALRQSAALAPVRRALRSSGLRGLDLGRRAQQYLHRLNADWEKTQVFCWSLYGCSSANVLGRFPSGTVAADDVPAVIERTREALSALRDAHTGEPVVKAVHPIAGPERGGGPLLPDLVVETPDFRYLVQPTFDPRWPVLLSPEEAGALGWPVVHASHRSEGVLLASGPLIEHSDVLPSADIMDCAPTFLRLLGIARPEYMEGRVLDDMLSSGLPGEQAAPPLEHLMAPQGETAYNADEQEEMERRLRDLGYME